MDGIGVMIENLFGSGSGFDLLDKAVGSLIKSLTLDGNVIHLALEDRVLLIRDNGQSCCENRYISTSDDLTLFAGLRFLGAELRDAPPVTDEYGEHEVQFFVVKTSLGFATFETHNEHNGYYGGFAITCTEQEIPLPSAAGISEATRSECSCTCHTPERDAAREQMELDKGLDT